MKKVIKTLGLALSVFCLLGCRSFIDSTIERRMTQQQEDEAAFLDGRLQVVLVGTGGPMASEDRVSTAIAVLAGGAFILVDAGPGVVRNLGLQGLPLGSLSAVFLTHFHSDHISDLGELAFMSWAQGRVQGRLPVYGPKGVEQVVEGYNMAYGLDSGYRTAHHGEAVMPSGAAGCIATTLTVSDPEKATVFFERNGLKASVFIVDHDPAQPAVGYRFEYRGKTVVITGDTKKIPSLIEHARGADLLISEALDDRLVAAMSSVADRIGRQRLARLLTDVQDYHMTPVQAAEVAQEAGAATLVFVHIVPPLVNFAAERHFMSGVKAAFDGKAILGEDGMTFVFDTGRPH
jgi:ribonuclease Z